MTTHKVFHFKNYELLCGAKVIDNGKFEPTLVISSNTWPSRPRTIAVQRGDCATEAAAIESAHAQGLEWIANFG
jgi:hypothetical protein